MEIQVFDTLRGGKQPFRPVKPGHVGMYVCGMTVQAPPHIGHMRAFFVADVIRRILRSKGYKVTLVQNFTDIDDKIIAKANAEGITYKELAERNIAAYFEAADWLGVERADHYPRATEHIPEILALIQDLMNKGYAYHAGGDVFFEVTKKSGYGDLSGKQIDELRAGVRIDVDEHKKHPVDFVLWKGAKPGEPFWESPWGPGRPGWHIECSAMAMKVFGATVDFHGGGRDLIFPHHENERAQSEASTGINFCNHWMENGLVNLGGQKMSKSTGVLFSVADVRNETEPEYLRLLLLSTHYRSPIEFSRDRLAESKTALERVQNFIASADHALKAFPNAGASELRGEEGDALGSVARQIDTLHHEAEEALADDFNTAGAIGKVFELVRVANSLLTEGLATSWHATVIARAKAAVVGLTGLLGLHVSSAGASDGAVPTNVAELVQLREAARKSRDFAAADRLRGEILALGFVVEDRADGSLVKRATE